jgi:hypothetical protein
MNYGYVKKWTGRYPRFLGPARSLCRQTGAMRSARRTGSANCLVGLNMTPPNE